MLFNTNNSISHYVENFNKILLDYGYYFNVYH